MALPSVRVPDPTEKEFEEIEVIPAGEYRARLAKVEEKPNNFDPNSPQLLWTWRIVDAPGAPLEDHPLWQYTSQKMGAFEDKETGQTKRSQARKNIEALLQRELAAGEELDWETDIIGHQALVSVIRKVNGAGEMRNKIVEVFPLSMVTLTTKGNAKPTDGSAPRSGEPTQISAALPESAGYIRRYELAKNALNLTPEQVTETIVALVGYNKPFWLLTPEDQKKVLEVLEPAAAATDVPFDAPPTAEEADELTAAGLSSAAPPKTSQPASSKHRVA